MAGLDQKRSTFLRRLFCCFPSRPKYTDFVFVKPTYNVEEEDYAYIVEKLSVKKVPVSIFEDYQRENIQNNVPRFPSRTSSDYEDTSEQCLAIYNLNSNNINKSSEDKVSIKEGRFSSHSTVRKRSVEYLKKCNFIKIVKSKLKNTKGNNLEVSTFSNNLEETEYQHNLQESFNSQERLKVYKKEKKHLKMYTFGCHSYIEQGILQKNNLESNCLIQKATKCDQSTQTCAQYAAILQNQIKVTASTNTESISQTVVNKSALTNGTLEPIKINLTLSTAKNKERHSQLDKICQTENKSSILRLNDIINANGSLLDINKKYPYRNQQNDQSHIKIPNTIVNVHYPENDIPEKESGYGLVETFRENTNILNIFKNEITNCFPERDIKSTSSSQSIAQNMAFDFQMGLNHAQPRRQILLHSIEDLHLKNAKEDNSIKESNGEGDKIYSSATDELPQSDSQFTQSITLTENNSESCKQVSPPSRNIQEIRNVNVCNNSPFISSNRHNKNLKKSTLIRPTQSNSPRLTEVQRIAELASSENNPIKWKIVIKQRKVPEELQKSQ